MPFRDQRSSVDDITGNRLMGPPDMQGRHSSDSTRYASLNPITGNGVGNPYGIESGYDFSPAPDYFSDAMEAATFFCSQTDLVYELPSTTGQAFNYQNY